MPEARQGCLEKRLGQSGMRVDHASHILQRRAHLEAGVIGQQRAGHHGRPAEELKAWPHSGFVFVDSDDRGTRVTVLLPSHQSDNGELA